MLFWNDPEGDDDVIALVHGDMTIVGFPRGELMLRDESDPDEIIARDHSTVARAKFSDPAAASYVSPPQDPRPAFHLIEVDENALNSYIVRVNDFGRQPAERSGGCTAAPQKPGEH